MFVCVTRKVLTDTRVVIDHAENAIAAPLHVVVGANAAEHWRQPQIRPCFVAQIPVNHERVRVDQSG